LSCYYITNQIFTADKRRYTPIVFIAITQKIQKNFVFAISAFIGG